VIAVVTGDVTGAGRVSSTGIDLRLRKARMEVRLRSTRSVTFSDRAFGVVGFLLLRLLEGVVDKKWRTQLDPFSAV
jgi:hypothetical protein